MEGVEWRGNRDGGQLARRCNHLPLRFHLPPCLGYTWWVMSMAKAESKPHLRALCKRKVTAMEVQ